MADDFIKFKVDSDDIADLAAALEEAAAEGESFAAGDILEELGSNLSEVIHSYLDSEGATIPMSWTGATRRSIGHHIDVDERGRLSLRVGLINSPPPYSVWGQGEGAVAGPQLTGTYNVNYAKLTAWFIDRKSAELDAKIIADVQESRQKEAARLGDYHPDDIDYPDPETGKIIKAKKRKPRKTLSVKSARDRHVYRIVRAIARNGIAPHDFVGKAYRSPEFQTFLQEAARDIRDLLAKTIVETFAVPKTGLGIAGTRIRQTGVIHGAGATGSIPIFGSTRRRRRR